MTLQLKVYWLLFYSFKKNIALRKYNKHCSKFSDTTIYGNVCGLDTACK